MRTTIALSLAAAGLVVAGAARAQVTGSAPEAAAALQACIAAAEGADEAATRASADRSVRLHEAWLVDRPGDPDARVGLARTLSQCRIPFASFMEQGALVGRSNALLEAALEIDPEHRGARFALAMNHYYTPEFLGRTKESIRHFEILLEQQGDRAEDPSWVIPWAFLGDLYLREGREDDAVEVWRRGLEIFPGAGELTTRLEDRAGPDEEADAETGEAETSPDTTGPPVDYTMEALVVEVDGGYAMDESRPGATLDRVDVYTTPGGTADILQVFQTLPGATRAHEGSDLYVRGGDPAEAPVLVEGARLLHAGVFEGLRGSVFGLLDPSVLKRAYFSSGGFSARYGNALSGVVELQTDGRPTVPTWRTGANFAGGGATIRTPLGGHAGIWASGRFTKTTLLDALHDQADEYPSSPRSVEGVAGLVWIPRPGSEVKAIALVEDDRSGRVIDAIGWRGPFQSEGRTELALVAARLARDDGTAAIRATVSGTSRQSAFAFGVLDRQRVDRALGARIDADLDGFGAIHRVGLEATRLTADETGRVPTTEQLHPDAPSEPVAALDESTRHGGAWAESEIPLSPRLVFVAGARLDVLPGETGATLDPRLSVAYRVGDWTVRGGGGTFRQGRWRTGYDLPDRGSPSGVPRRARHLAAGLEREGEPFVKVEAYHKRYGAYVAEPDDDGPAITSGRTNGLDALVRWRGDERWSGWVSWSLLAGRLDLEDGREVSSEYDVTHSFTAVGTWARSGWQLGATARYATGRPYTPILGSEPGERGPEPIYGAPHGARLDDYARLDARVTRYTSLSGGLLVVYLEMLNVLDRANASAIVYDETYENPRAVESVFADRTFVLGFELQH